jgi:hypothetical protein
VVCVWYLVFISHFKDQFLFKDPNREELPLIDHTSNLHALSFDVDEDALPSSMKSSGDPGDLNRVSPVKGGRKKVNTVSDPKGDFDCKTVPYSETPVKKFSVQTSEESSIVKAEQMDLIASWLPGTALRSTKYCCAPFFYPSVWPSPP